MKHRSFLQTGFTIVELLVVIVVIGILAGLVLNSYNGIQQRARDTQTRVAVKTIADALLIWRSDTGLLPPQGGFDYASTGQNADGSCVGGTGQGWIQKGMYVCTLEDMLVAQKYIPSNTLTGLTDKNGNDRRRVMMLYPCTSSTTKWGLFYYLESPSSTDSETLNAATNGCRASPGYGMQAMRLIEF